MKMSLAHWGAVLLIIVVVLTALGNALGLDLSHDEHQFIAPAVLEAREGLLPYRDVPIFHQPYLIFIDAWMARLFDSPLLGARLVSGLAASATGLLLFGATWQATRNQTAILRLSAAGSLTILWLTSNLFLISSGRTWNHDLPSLFAVSAMAILLFAKSPGKFHWLAAGILAGLATGGRLTMAPFAGILPLTALLYLHIPWRERFVYLGIATLGVLLALAPSFWLFFQDPDGYIFGNFQFPRLPLLEVDNSRITKTLAPWRKLRFFFKEVLKSNLPLVIAAVFLGVTALRGRKVPWRWISPSLALLAGAFAPSRYEMQHFYIVAPLAALLAARSLYHARPAVIHGLLAAALIGGIVGWKIFINATEFFDREDWDVTEMHRYGQELRTRVPTGRVLTLAPIIVLEGGLSIYPALATGPFGWNFAYLIPKDRRKSLGLIAPDDLAEALALNPPAAVMTGLEKEKLERPLIRYARKHGYLPEILGEDVTLWRKPLPTPPNPSDN